MKNTTSNMLSSGWIWTVQLTLVLLKITDNIDWTWWEVCTPLIVWMCMVGSVAAIVFVAAAYDEYVWRKRSRR